MPVSKTVVPRDLGAYLQVFAQCAPQLGEPLAADVEQLTASRRDPAWLGSAWRTSALAYNGMPVEFTSSTFQPDGLSCTVDPFLGSAGQDLSVDALIPHFERVEPLRSETSFQKVRRLQAGASLRFGSWLGLKYRAGARALKVYSELPANAERPIASEWMDPFEVTELAERGWRLLMNGYYPNRPDKGMEYYFEWHRADFGLTDLAELMMHLGLAALYPDLSTLLENAALLTPESGQFTPTTYGCSLACGADGQIEVFTVFTMTRTFFGGDHRAHSAIRKLLRHYDWRMSHLEALWAENLAVEHNVIGFSITRGQTLGMNVTFSPANKSYETRTVAVASPPVVTPSPSLPELLERYQLPNGAFPATVRTPNQQSFTDANAFVTAQVLRCLDDDREIEPYLTRALDFLESCAVGERRFAFWPREGHPEWMREERLAADVDDTAIVAEVLYRYGRWGREDLLATVAELNKFCLTKLPKSAAPWLRRGVYLTWMDHRAKLNLVDACANTNVLIALFLAGKRGTLRYRAILEMLRAALEGTGDDYGELRKVIPYYAHPAEWARTLAYGVDRGMVELVPLLATLERQWPRPPEGRSGPLYCRHDGHFIWTSTCLSKVRSHLKNILRAAAGSFSPLLRCQKRRVAKAMLRFGASSGHK
ncbi:MAG: hypothetical protein AAF146_07330 [Bacteroidota bacterium]